MRASLTLLPIIACIGAHAQLADPGFEEYGAGWQHWCDWEFVPDVPPNGGMVSVRMPVVSGISPDCFVNEDLQPLIYQELPNVQNGDQLQIRFWAKAIPDTLDDALWMSATVILGWLTGPTTFEYDFSTNNYQTAGAPGTWGENIVSMTCGDIPVGNNPVLFLGGHGFNTTPGVIYLDNVEVELISTAIEEPMGSSVHFRPNPATDKLWMDLPVAPISIIAIDASGRSHALNNFTHRDHTVEVDVRSLPAGITLLRINTNSGTWNLRFLKM